jgi:hypothetical protein
VSDQANPMQRVNGWNEHRALVMSELKRLGEEAKERHVEIKDTVIATEIRLIDSIKDVERNQRNLTADLIGLKVKVAALGSIAGIAGALLTMLMKNILTS